MDFIIDLYIPNFKTTLRIVGQRFLLMNKKNELKKNKLKKIQILLLENF